MNIFKSVEGIFDKYSQSKNMANFLNLQGKLEPPTSNDQEIAIFIPTLKVDQTERLSPIIIRIV